MTNPNWDQIYKFIVQVQQGLKAVEARHHVVPARVIELIESAGDENVTYMAMMTELGAEVEAATLEAAKPAVEAEPETPPILQ